MSTGDLAAGHSQSLSESEAWKVDWRLSGHSRPHLLGRLSRVHEAPPCSPWYCLSRFLRCLRQVFACHALLCHSQAGGRPALGTDISAEQQGRVGGRGH